MSVVFALRFNHPQKQIERVGDGRSTGDQFENVVLASQQPRTVVGFLLGPLPFGDVMEEDGEAVGRGKDAVFEPAIPGLVAALHVNEDLLRHRPLIGEVKRLSNAFREFRPDMAAEEVFRTASEQAGRLRVHVGVAPVPVEGDEAIAHTLENVSKVLDAGAGRFKSVLREIP